MDNNLNLNGLWFDSKDYLPTTSCTVVVCINGIEKDDHEFYVAYYNANDNIFFDYNVWEEIDRNVISYWTRITIPDKLSNSVSNIIDGY